MLRIEPYTDEKRKHYSLESERDPGFAYFDDRGDYNGYLAAQQDEPLYSMLMAFSDKHLKGFPLYENRDKTEAEIIQMITEKMAE